MSVHNSNVANLSPQTAANAAKMCYEPYDYVRVIFCFCVPDRRISSRKCLKLSPDECAQLEH